MTFRISNTRLLDYKECYSLWAKERISIYKIPNILAERGVVNLKKAKSITPQAVWRAAWLYALDNLDEARVDTAKLFTDRGLVLTDIDWYNEVLTKARQLMNRNQYRLYLDKHPILKEYVKK